MKFVSGNIIEIDRELSDLDKFALDFIRILRKHIDYVIVSGYVSIILGRARASEDIDVIIPATGEGEMNGLFESLKVGFYCLNTEDNADIYENLKSGIAARFARKGKVIPNIEMKFAKTKADEISLSESISVKFGGDEIKVSPLEMQIAFKESVLKSPKDIEDARHIRNVSEGHIDGGKISKYKVLLDGIYGRKRE